MSTNRKALYQPTKNLTINYTFKNDEHEDANIRLDGKNIHAQLFAACKDFKKIRSNLTYANGRSIYTSSLNEINFSTAAITVLFSDTSAEEGYLGENIYSASFALYGFKKNRLITCRNLYDIATTYYQANITAKNKAVRNDDFNFRLSQRIKAFSQVSNNYDFYKAVANSKALTKAIAKPNFHETFHHTEQAEMDVLSDPFGISLLSDAVYDVDAKYVYGLVLDLYTDRPLCCNCNVCLIGMQYSNQQGFLADFKESLLNNRIETRENDNLMLSVRVSASSGGEPFNLASNNQHEYNPDKKCVIYQAKNTHFNVNQIIRKKSYSLSTFYGSIFTSKYVPSEKLSDDISLDLDLALNPIKI